MTIVGKLTPTQYKLLRFAVQRDGEGGLLLMSDVAVYNAAGQRVGTDNPTPQATPAQLSAFLAWINSNLATYETATGLTPLVGPEPE